MATVLKTIYVGNLPYGVTDETLTELFAQYGEVAAVWDQKAGSGLVGAPE